MSAAFDMGHQRETKQCGGKIIEYKTVHLDNDVEVGVIDAYIATWDLDEGNDQFLPGAFRKSIREHRSRDNRQVRLKDDHGRIVGGFPIDTVKEDARGLRAIGNINLGVGQGAEMWELIKQGVLVDMSIGFTAINWKIIGDVREISESIIWEGSVLGEPMNRRANIVDIKAFHALPVASADHPWDAEKAMDRVIESPFDMTKARIGRTLVCDIVGDQMTVIPKALQDLAKETKDPEEVCAIERHLSAAGIPSPFDREMRQFWDSEGVKSATARELEGVFLGSGRLSKSAAKLLVAKITGHGDGAVADDMRGAYNDLISALRG